MALSLAFSAHAAAPPVVTKATLEALDGAETLTLELSKCIEIKAFALEHPPRVAIDLPPVAWKAAPVTPVGAVTKLRRGWHNVGTYRVVLDMVEPRPVTSQTRAPHRGGCTVSVTVGGKPSSFRRTAKPSEPEPQRTAVVAFPQPRFKPLTLAREAARPVVVIDAGHGGKDPGAVAGSGEYEKHLMLTYAHALRSALLKTGRYRVALTRDSDVFIPLRERVERARAAGADLFLSLHADIAQDAQARGLSVYTLSETASDKETELLAAQENQVDTVAGVDLRHENEAVADILVDLARRETKNRSAVLAEKIVRAVSPRMRVLPKAHRFAGFAVLKGPDVPAVLVEVGFLSHPSEGRLLASPAHRERVVSALTGAVDGYFAKYPLEGH